MARPLCGFNSSPYFPRAGEGDGHGFAPGQAAFDAGERGGLILR